MTIAKQTNTQLHDWDENQQLFDTNGNPLAPDVAAEYGSLIWDDGLIASAFEYSRKNTATIDPNESLLDFFRKQVAKLFTDLPYQEAEKKRETLLHITQFWGAYVGSPVSRQSLKYFWLEECIEGENPFVAETYHKILAHVAKAALKRADIRFESKVNAITCRGEGGKERPSISVQGSKTEEFDEVVVTAPLGWLKRNKDAFKPGLTPEVEKAIDSLGYGSLDKACPSTTNPRLKAQKLTSHKGLYKLPNSLLGASSSFNSRIIIKPSTNHLNRPTKHNPKRNSNNTPSTPISHNPNNPLPRLHPLALPNLRPHQPPKVGLRSHEPSSPTPTIRAPHPPLLYLRSLRQQSRGNNRLNPSFKPRLSPALLFPLLLFPSPWFRGRQSRMCA